MTILRRRPALVPIMLLVPGIAWLAAFYVYPAFQMFLSSFWSGSLERGFSFALSNDNIFYAKFLQLKRSSQSSRAGTDN